MNEQKPQQRPQQPQQHQDPNRQKTDPMAQGKKEQQPGTVRKDDLKEQTGNKPSATQQSKPKSDQGCGCG